MNQNEKLETNVLGGGCFWCLEPLFADLKGVESVEVGYAGGKKESPSYEDVCSGTTGHAEVVKVAFDPEEISLQRIFEVFFSMHDPTTMNRQGADIGSQYRSIILYANEAQKNLADEVIRELGQSGQYSKPIVTEVVPLQQFYPAEEYHQRYFEKNPWAGYCQIVIRPKVAKFQKKFAEERKSAAS
ncbi:MAG: peptide-methionine (S)-S-oxide reductase [Chloroflexi bacterium 44-23]|nr:MAG: peptide-methionine (S)-S-oxide reductase [Chloroflexi bacterium 44-23]